MKIDSIIFDLDGTLWDSTETVSESWSKTLAEHYGPVKKISPEDVAGIMGLTGPEIAEKLFSGFGEKRFEVCELCLSEEPAYIAVHGGIIYSGVEEMLAALSERYPLFIVSNCQKGYIESFLHYSGYGKYFLDFECEGNTGLGKADNIRLLRERRQLENPVYVGDTAGDEKSAMQAGCEFIHAAYGFGRAIAPIASIGSPAELEGVLKILKGE